MLHFTTIDVRNPAPVDMDNLTFLVAFGIHISELLQDVFHQWYVEPSVRMRFYCLESGEGVADMHVNMQTSMGFHELW